MAKILIVDDSPTETYKFRQVLEKAGHEVLEAHSGEDGVKMTKANFVDLVLMDVVMPGLNGFQATRQLSKDAATSEVPVIIVTTKDQETDRVWGKRHGAVGYLTKPVADAVLLQAVERVLSGEGLV